jgi:hypothetical protein
MAGSATIFPSAAMADELNRIWLEKSSQWCKTFLLDPCRPSLGSWLDSAGEGAGLAVGCKACFAQCFKTVWGKYMVRSPAMLQHYVFRRHSNSVSHIVAVQKMLHRSLDAVLDHVSPGADEFKKLMGDILGNKLGEIDRKTKQKLWCLHEALKALDQSTLNRAAAIFLFRDERDARLLVRFRAVSHDLECKVGVLGQERAFGTGARQVLKATGNVIVRACTRFHGAPPSSAGSARVAPKPFLKAKLLRHVRKSVIGLTCDSAADEILAAEMMRDADLAQSAAMTPHLRYIIRDKAHASRRLISRPWSVDDFLKDVVMMFCRGRGSVARLIQNSKENRRLFEQFAQTTHVANIKNVVKNFRAAGHRFESYQKPLGRTCLYIIASIRLASYLALRRTDAHGKLASEFCLWINSEKCLQAAMLADASDQLMVLTRVVDNEDVDPITANREVSMFVAAIELWFGYHRQCLELFGYTSTMLQTLSSSTVWHVNGKVCSIGFEGGVPASIIDRCLDRMQSWIRLAKETVAAEFPYFELSQAFNAFDVTQGSPPDNAKQCLARIAQAESLPELELIRQWEDIYPRALAAAGSMTGHTTNKDAWLTAVTGVGRHHMTSRAHPTNVLMKALMTWRVVGISSSGVEQSFSKNCFTFGDHRQSAHSGTEEMHIKLSLDLARHDEATLIKKARRVWAFCYGLPRTPERSRRVDKGLKRKLSHDSSGDPTSEIGFLRKRRQVTQEALAAGTYATAASSCLPLPLSWTDKHETELQFQQNKVHRRKVEAVAENLMLRGETDVSQLRVEAAELRQEQVRMECARIARTGRITAALSGQTLEEFRMAVRHKQAYISDDCMSVDLVNALASFSLVQCDDIVKADVFVMKNPGHGRAGDMLVSALKGCYQISPGLLQSAQGHALKFKPAMRQPRVLFASQRFTSTHSAFCNLVEKVLAAGPAAGCKMKLQFSPSDESMPNSEWRALIGKFKNKPAQLIGLVLHSESEHAAFAEWKHVYTASQIVKQLTIVDSAASMTNLFAANVSVSPSS